MYSERNNKRCTSVSFKSGQKFMKGGFQCFPYVEKVTTCQSSLSDKCFTNQHGVKEFDIGSHKEHFF